MKTYEEVNEAVFGFLPSTVISFTREFLHTFQFNDIFIDNLFKGLMLVTGIMLYVLSSMKRVQHVANPKKYKFDYQDYLPKYLLTELFGFLIALGSYTFLFSAMESAAEASKKSETVYEIALAVPVSIGGVLVGVLIVVLGVLYFALFMANLTAFGLMTTNYVLQKLGVSEARVNALTEDTFNALQTKHNELTNEWSEYFEDLSEPRLSGLLEASVKAEDAREKLEKYDKKNAALLTAYAEAIDNVETEFIKTEVEDA